METITFSVKTTVYHTTPSGRRVRRDFDGPWKKSPEEAVTAYLEKMKKQTTLANPRVCNAFLAETAPEATAPAKDNKGVCYKTSDKINVMQAIEAAKVATLTSG